MKKIPLHGYRGEIRAYALVDDKDYERVVKLKWNIGGVYACHGFSPTVYLHNFIMGCRGVDHKNRDGLDCQRHNLRLATQSQNMANRGKHSNNTSGFKGVSWHRAKKKWRTQIGVRGKKFHLGYFDSLAEAAKSYDEAAKKYFGEFASPNFPMRFPRYAKIAK